MLLYYTTFYKVIYLVIIVIVIISEVCIITMMQIQNSRMGKLLLLSKITSWWEMGDIDLIELHCITLGLVIVCIKLANNTRASGMGSNTAAISPPP